LRRLVWPLFALAAGALWAACFGIEPLKVAPWMGMAPLLLLVGRGRSGWLVFAGGLAFWSVSLRWIVPTMVRFGGLSEAATWPLFSLLAAVLALFSAGFALVARRPFGMLGPIGAMTAAASAWVVFEWMRSWVLGGFPWNLAAYSWIEVPGALEASAWLGAYGVSFLVVWSNAGLARSLLDRDWRPLAWGLAVPIALLGTAWRWSERSLAETSAGPLLEARVLQPNIPNRPEWDPAANHADYRRLIAQSLAACDAPGALLIWPESAAWPRRLGHDVELDRDIAELNRRGCGVVLNMARSEGERYFNSAVLVRPDGSRSSYDKRHLVPFGEYVPFRSLLPAADALTRHVGDFTAGEGVDLLDYRGVSLGGAICYEVVFPQEVVQTVAAGATVLFSVTNDDWYGPTAAAWQHLTAARFRAAENHRTLLRAAVTGVSAVIAPDGSLVDRVRPGEQRTMRAGVTARTDRTLYSRIARWVPWSAIAVCAFAILLAGRTGRPDRSSRRLRSRGTPSWTQPKRSNSSTA
jgi:apolipoprotein N-acyltransferase